jgi:hypothetical protein
VSYLKLNIKILINLKKKKKKKLGVAGHPI